MYYIYIYIYIYLVYSNQQRVDMTKSRLISRSWHPLSDKHSSF
jgi:hypothetical protein